MVPNALRSEGTPKASKTTRSCSNNPKKHAPNPSATQANSTASTAIPPSTHQYGTGHRSTTPSPEATLSSSEYREAYAEAETKGTTKTGATNNPGHPNDAGSGNVTAQ